MKRILALILIACMTAMVLTGCQSQSVSAVESETGTEATVDSTQDAQTTEDTQATEAVVSEEIDYTQGDPVVLVAATGVVMNNPIQLAISEMNRILTEKTGGRITLDEYHNSALGSERELLEQESIGMVDMVGGGSQVAYNFVQDCGLFDLPYLFMSNEHAKAVLSSEIGQNILNEFDGTGIKALGWVACGWRNVTSNTEINSPADMVGKKVRVLENQVYIDMFSALGASPTPMAFTELYTALQQGTVDGEDNPLIVINSAKFDEVQKYIYLTQHTFAAGLITMSQDTWDSLSETDQQLIASVAADMLDYSFEASAQVEETSKEEILARGKATISEVNKEEWAEIMRTIYPTYEEVYGKELIDSILNFDY